ncbi:MAG: hypothetical protein KBD83_05230 [Gammaproteobacteria bacterium]|nr:hypothetical protein [Gammaproteobacteria bacterium]
MQRFRFEAKPTQSSEEKFSQLMLLDQAEFEQLTQALALSILHVDSSEEAVFKREITGQVAETKPGISDFLKKFAPPPTAEELSTTSDTRILENSRKGTDHHVLYKDMLSLTPEQKEQLIEKFGITLTKFAICNLINLYIEGNKLDGAKGVRNLFAVGRQFLGAVVAATDRELKLEFFTHLLSQLSHPLPLMDFITNTRSDSQYERAREADDATYIGIIRDGVNTANALTLFDKNTLEIIERAAVVSEAKMDYK